MKCPFESSKLEALSHDFEGFKKIFVQLDEGKKMMWHKGIEICGLVHALASKR